MLNFILVRAILHNPGTVIVVFYNYSTIRAGNVCVFRGVIDNLGMCTKTPEGTMWMDYNTF